MIGDMRGDNWLTLHHLLDLVFFLTSSTSSFIKQFLPQFTSFLAFSLPFLFHLPTEGGRKWVNVYGLARTSLYKEKNIQQGLYFSITVSLYSLPEFLVLVHWGRFVILPEVMSTHESSGDGGGKSCQ